MEFSENGRKAKQRKLKVGEQKPHKKPLVKSGAPEGWAVLDEA